MTKVLHKNVSHGCDLNKRSESFQKSRNLSKTQNWPYMNFKIRYKKNRRKSRCLNKNGDLILPSMTSEVILY